MNSILPRFVTVIRSGLDLAMLLEICSNYLVGDEISKKGLNVNTLSAVDDRVREAACELVVIYVWTRGSY